MLKINPSLKWSTTPPKEKRGIIVGCNAGMERLLPWWWENYNKTNTFPVTFFDFGMSKKALKWCSERGTTVQLKLPFSLFAKRLKCPEIWEKEMRRFGKYNTAQYRRLSWFKKTFVYLNTPYQQTIWMDLDCQVNENLEELFLYSDHPSQMAIANERHNKWKMKTEEGWKASVDNAYNSGVISYRHGCQIIEDWTLAVINSDNFYLGDQDLLCNVIEKSSVKPNILPNSFNWIVNEHKQNPHAHILHYAGKARKLIL